ncbi:MAG TPA: hypothetical protein VFK65_05020 [Candidatus Binatia bacterium]|nr:hypothetical protein [Candidatus Binatia bacterium]
MTAQQLLDRLTKLFPGFESYWDDPENCFREDDGSFTVCGVFSEFSSFFREHFVEFPVHSLSRFGDFVTECMSGSSIELDDATATCFLENVAGEPFSSAFRRFLKGPALKFYEEVDRQV